MSTGFLHIGPPGHGVRTYGEVLAAATPGSLEGTRLRDLRGADVLHVQYARGLWTGLPRTTKPLVVTVHDLHEALPPPRGRVTTVLSAADRLRDPHHRTLQLLARRARVLVVASPEEAARLAREHPRRTVVIPHLVPQVREPRAPASGTLLMLGWIHPRKGHHLAVEALPHLPDARLTIAGGAAPGHEPYLERLHQTARELGVEDRVRITGFLPETLLQHEALTARLALCPYERVAASGSMALLIGCRTPILATATPYAERLAAQLPGAVTTYRGPLADAVARALDQRPDETVMRLYADAHSPGRTAEAHAHLYRR